MSTMAQKSAILASLHQQNIEKCDDCSGFIAPGKFSYVRLPLKNEAGDPIYDKDGQPRHTQVALKVHVFPHSRFDPTGLVAVTCTHGVRTHPDPEIQGSLQGRLAVSWVRGKYVKVGPPSGTTCPVCRGEEAPPDMLGALPA